MGDNLEFYLYRDSTTTSDQLVRNLIEEIKGFVFENNGILLSAQGYSGVPLIGEIPTSLNENEIYKVINTLFILSEKVQGLVFRIVTKNAKNNPFFIESLKNDVLPKCAKNEEEFVSSLFGYGGVLHSISPRILEKNPKTSKVDIVRDPLAGTRNILVTEAVKQKLDFYRQREFGMHRIDVNVPSTVAYIAKERPDLLSAAIREFSNVGEESAKKFEKSMDIEDCVMVHVYLNEKDFRTVTAVADIESPDDIISHRVSLALLTFDAKHSAVLNGVDSPVTGIFQKVPDHFERERLESIRAAVFGAPQTISHMYQTAKKLTTEDHIAECRRVFVDTSSAEHHSQRSEDEGNNFDDNMKYVKKQVFKKKKRNGLGKKRQLASVLPKRDAPEVPTDECCYAAPPSSDQLQNFERAVNGEDVYYKESSDGDSLGEEEDMELFVTKSKKKILEEMRKKSSAKVRAATSAVAAVKLTEIAESEDDDGFDVADLLRGAPPLAKTDDFDDF